MKQNMGNYRANILKKNKLASDSVVKAFFITAEEISVVRKEGRRIEEVLVCKESLPTASTCADIAQVQMVGKMNRQTVAKFAIVQKESNVHFLHIGVSLKDLGKKLFAFSKLEISPEVILNVISKTEIS